jgi:hypothetical protein
VADTDGSRDGGPTYRDGGPTFADGNAAAPPETGPFDSGPAPEARFAYIYGETSSDMPQSTGGATFYVDPQPDPTCAFLGSANACSVALCPFGASNASIDAGSFVVTDGTTTLDITFDPASTTYVSSVPNGPPFAAPSILTIRGDENDQTFGSFMSTLRFPTATKLESPDLTADLVIDTAQDLPLVWGSVPNETLFYLAAIVQATGEFATLTCYFDGPSGSATVPHEDLQIIDAMAPSSLEVVAEFASIQRQPLPIGEWTVETLALGRGGASGQVELR